MLSDILNNLHWINPQNNSQFSITGFLSDSTYVRIPEDKLEEVAKDNQALSSLVKHTSGGMMRFSTNSSDLALCVNGLEAHAIHNMAESGVCGFDAYLFNQESQTWQYLNVTNNRITETNFKAILFSNLPGEKEVLIHFPLFAKVKEVLVGINQDAIVNKTRPFSLSGKLVFYGTSITQGANASRPGLSYVDQISRHINAEVLNLGFSGNGLGETSIINIIKEINDMRMLIIDYDANAGATGALYSTMIPLIEETRKYHPTIPIIVISRIFYILESYQTSIKQAMKKRRDFQKEVVEASNDKHLYYIDGRSLLSPEPFDCFSDQIHLNDLGFYNFSQNLIKYIEQILKSEGVEK